MSWKVIEEKYDISVTNGKFGMVIKGGTSEEALEIAAVIVNALNAQESKSVRKGTILIATHECSGGLIIGKKYEVIDLNDSAIVVKSEITNSHHFYLDENESAYWGNYFKLKENKPEVMPDNDVYQKAYSYVYTNMPNFDSEVNIERLKCYTAGYNQAKADSTQQQYNGLPNRDEIKVQAALNTNEEKEPDSEYWGYRNGATWMRSIAQQRIQGYRDFAELVYEKYKGSYPRSEEWKIGQKAKQLLNK